RRKSGGTKTMRREWTINGRFLTQKVTGVQRYGREIVAAIDALMAEGHPLARELDLEILIPSSHRGSLPEFQRIRSRPAGRFGGQLWEQLTLPRHAPGGSLNLCNTGPVSRRKQIVCIHDLNPTLFPRSYSLPFRTAYSVLLPTLGHVVASITTVSEFSAKLLVDHRIAQGTRPQVIPDGHEHVFRWNSHLSPQAAHQAADAPRPNTIVLLGSLALHKNISVVLQLAPRLAAHGLCVAVVGRRDLRVFGQSGNAAHEGILWLGALSDDELAMLLRTSLCLAFPSLIEGFGLPPLEAM